MDNGEKLPKELPMPKPYDATTKTLIEVNPQDWLEFLGLPLFPVTILNAELSTVTSEADVALLVDDPSGAYILHIEFQGSYDALLDRRVLRYNVQLEEKFSLPVVSVVILLRREADGAAILGMVQRTMPNNLTHHDFGYTLSRVWEIPAEQLLSGGIALLPLAPVAQIEQSELPQLISKIQARFDQETQGDKQGRLWTAVGVLMGLRYDDALIELLLKGVRGMRESVFYQRILREGEEKGLREGEVVGKILEAKSLILRQGNKRFGTPNSAIVARIEAEDALSALEALSLRLLEVENWDELLAPTD